MLIRESLAASLPAMRRSEADVARRLLRDPGRVASHSLREVAAWCGTSDATVVRACRAAGYDGFQDLKYHVLRELTGPGKAPAAERTGDAQPDYTADIAAGLAASTAALPQALRLLKSATRVAFAGVGASLGIGMILTDVLSAMGRQALPLADEQALHFILTPPVKGLVLMAISHSGESRFALKAATEARRAGVPVIGVSNERPANWRAAWTCICPRKRWSAPKAASPSPRVSASSRCWTDWWECSGCRRIGRRSLIRKRRD